ncbi:DUF1214 domain-containing protein [Sphingobium sp. EM0848]|uniref:DUF1214 domain-containing protein n=1 Tax=Sphingobium sp. EM0848 TaxID=2743473 RepID=UPI00159C05E9|nr:DUF1214 domain-containing protein [Sphingobium sp. EM0848]
MNIGDEEAMSFSRRHLLAGSGGLGAFLMAGSIPSADAAGIAGDPQMLQAFDAMLARIGKIAELAFARSTARYPDARAAGLLHIMNNIALGLSMNLHNADPMNPELFHFFDPTRKQGGDNSDALYLAAAIDGSQEYRLHGDRGTAKHLSLTTVDKGPPPWGGKTGGALYGRDMVVGADGRFEVILSAREHPGNWLKLTPDVFRLTIRQFFADWENERPMTARIERLGPPAAPPDMSADRIMAALDATVVWIESTVRFWQDTMDLFRKTPNQYVDWRKITGNKVNATPGGDPACCYWQVPKGKALILRVTPPACEYWNIEFNNPWWETNDYRYRHTGINGHSAVLEENGELIAVVAHQDPGLPNWLDPSGHTEGMMGRRWMFAESAPQIETMLVDQTDIRKHLPKTVKIISPEGRREQLERKRRGLYRRFHWF